jgi:uncharacterized protein
VETMSHIFRIPGNGRPISCFQLAGIPSEVVNSVASVLCRMAFEIALWSDGGIRILVLCEEAHRYVPADPNLGFVPTRQAISRIAKEGRKYGVSLGVVTQRPGELDPTILSQCSTNDRDQEIIRSAIADSSSSTTSFLSSIGNREAIAFGEAVAVPMRMIFERIPERSLPKANGSTKSQDGEEAELDLRMIVQRMRNLSTNEAAGLTGAPVPEFLPQAGETAAYAGSRMSQPGDNAYGTARAAPSPATHHHAEAQRPAPSLLDGSRYREPQPSLSSQDPETAPPRPTSGGSSLRAQLLKKPLSSLRK